MRIRPSLGIEIYLIVFSDLPLGILRKLFLNLLNILVCGKIYDDISDV